jgi:hypothetical protein
MTFFAGFNCLAYPVARRAIETWRVEYNYVSYCPTYLCG